VEYKGYGRKEEEGCGELKTIGTRTKIIILLLPGFNVIFLVGFIMRTSCTTTNCIISMRNKKQKN